MATAAGRTSMAVGSKGMSVVAGVLLLCVVAMVHGDNRDSPLGMNISGLSYSNTQVCFTNIFRTTNVWSTNTGTLQLRPDGYPAELASGQEAKAMMMRDLGTHMVRGDYTLLYDGEGTWGTWLNTSIKSQEPGKVVFSVGLAATGNGFGPIIKTTNPANPIRNVRVYLPGLLDIGQQQMFDPNFLHTLRNYSVLRFMDWASTNHSSVVNWSDRARPDYYRGVAIEHMIALSNTLNADPWFCIPHRANDNYVRQHAMLVRDSLKPGLRAYVEYSNECWNWNFGQTTYCDSMAAALGIEVMRHMKFYSKRSVEIFAIWEDVFGGTDRLVRVLAAQSNNQATGSTVCAYNDAWKNSDVLAVAPYFGNGVSSTSVTDILNQCQADIDGDRVTSRTAQNKATADRYGLRLVAYESGQHLTQRNPSDAMVSAFIAANYDPRMGTLYTNYYTAWKQQGGTLMCVFASMGPYSKWGSWGILEWADQDTLTAPKYLATQQFAVNTPRWWSEPALSVVPEGRLAPVATPLSPALNRLTVVDLVGRQVIGVPSLLESRPVAPGVYVWRKSGSAQPQLAPLR